MPKRFKAGTRRGFLLAGKRAELRILRKGFCLRNGILSVQNGLRRLAQGQKGGIFALQRGIGAAVLHGGGVSNFGGKRLGTRKKCAGIFSRCCHAHFFAPSFFSYRLIIACPL